MKILLLPSLSCNLKCEYCYLNSNKTKDVVESMKMLIVGGSRKLSAKWYVASLDNFVDKYGGKVTSIDISGGEPFLVDNFTDLVKCLRDKYGSVNITSNLEMIPDKFFELNPTGIFITASLHLKDGKVRDDFMEKLSELKKRGFKFGLNFVGYPKQIRYYEKCRNIAKQFGTYCHLEPYIDYNSVKTGFGAFDNKDDEEYLMNSITMPDALGMSLAMDRGTKEIECGVAEEYLVVTENGDVWPCLGMMFERRFLIGNIFSGTIFKRKKDMVPIKCDIFCPCAQNYRDGLR